MFTPKKELLYPLVFWLALDMAPIIWKNKTSDNSQQSAQIFSTIDNFWPWVDLIIGHNSIHILLAILRNWYHLEMCTTWIVINLLSFYSTDLSFSSSILSATVHHKLTTTFYHNPLPQNKKKPLEYLVTQRVHVFANLSSIGDKTSCFPYCCHECWIYETIYERITHSVYKVKVEYINIEFNDFQFHHPSW